mmetsp:Transcript_16598/g.31463  ORF Transcript_16598/g.31463 Transcript_16598/m.31463 type:complete len:292 (-) Transcript_16598:328-1203(-)
MVKRRYNDFRKAQREIKEELGGRLAKLPGLYPKMFVSHTKPKFIERRRETLEKYLKALHDMNVGSKALERFLTEERMAVKNIFDLILLTDDESKKPRLQSLTNSLEGVSWYLDGHEKKCEHNNFRPPPRPRTKPPPLPKTPIPSKTPSMQNPPYTVLPMAKWVQARRELVEEEKKLRIQVESLAKRRKALPWVKVTKEYKFIGKEGQQSLEELFEGKDELRLYHIARSSKNCEKWYLTIETNNWQFRYRWVDAVRQSSKAKVVIITGCPKFYEKLVDISEVVRIIMQSPHS